MDDKKKLLDSSYDLDSAQSLPPVAIQKTIAEQRWTKDHAAPRRAWRWYWLIIFVVGVLAASALISAHIASRNKDVLKFHTSFRGGSGQLINQEVVSSTIDNIVEYHVTATVDERVTIIDDFNLEIQIMKISSAYQEVCFVSKMKEGEHVRPADVVFGANTDKSYASQVFEASEKPIDDVTILGSRGGELCQNLPVYWVHPATETDTTITAANFTSDSVSSPMVHSRSKRNIRSCRTSCCWRVCCCDVKHFNWESVERFTCQHVCLPCTHAYKKVIEKYC